MKMIFKNGDDLKKNEDYLKNEDDLKKNNLPPPT